MHYTQNLPLASVGWSALIAAVPLLTVLVLLGVFRLKAQWAGLAALGVSLAVALFAYGMPAGLTFDAAGYGAANSVLTVLWITFNAIWIYNLTVETGHFAVLRRAFAAISDDRRIQAIVIAFSFGALMEALAGGGSPIAICSVMLIAAGFPPLKAAVIALLADTAPVAFGGMGNPITILGSVTHLNADDFGAMTGRQAPVLAFLVPFLLVAVADGPRALRQVWPAALTAGATFCGTQFALANYWDYKLCDIFAALVSAGAVVALNRVWQPADGGSAPAPGTPPVIAGGAVDHDPVAERRAGRPEGGDGRRDVLVAFAPYVIVVVLFSLAQIDPVKGWLARGTAGFQWPGLAHITTADGAPVSTFFSVPWASTAGTLLFVSGVLTALVLRLSPLKALRVYGSTIRQFGWAIFTVLCVFALSYVMNLSGQITTLGLWLAQTGAAFAFLSPLVGWFGVAVTGTDAGSDALFGGLQLTAAHQLGASPILFGAANTTGGVLAKMISPQNLAIGTAAVGTVGAEGTLFRRVFGWSAALMALLCVLVYLQSTSVLGWMVVGG
ncbi:L-lactate permease [Streptomyces sp. NPDC047002]|uniref:L-lactate permease n=1 Tax=Streptomyces sp. NPDC047002 TaxID=3155475 RepID=UPI003453B45A